MLTCETCMTNIRMQMDSYILVILRWIPLVLLYEYISICLLLDFKYLLNLGLLIIAIVCNECVHNLLSNFNSDYSGTKCNNITITPACPFCWGVINSKSTSYSPDFVGCYWYSNAWATNEYANGVRSVYDLLTEWIGIVIIITAGKWIGANIRVLYISQFEMFNDGVLDIVCCMIGSYEDTSIGFHIDNDYNIVFMLMDNWDWW